MKASLPVNRIRRDVGQSLNENQLGGVMKNVIGVLALALVPAVAAAADKPDWAFPVTEKVRASSSL